MPPDIFHIKDNIAHWVEDQGLFTAGSGLTGHLEG